MAGDSSGKLSEKEDEKMSKTEESAIDETYDTNWCDMPPEIKLECIGKMDFNMRGQLRQTARAENQLVNSLRPTVKRVFLDSYRCSFNDISWKKYGSCYAYTNYWLLYVLKHCDVEWFEVYDGRYLKNHIDFGELDTVLKPKTIFWAFPDYEKSDFDALIQFCKICWNQVENIHVVNSDDDIIMRHLFVIPSVFNASSVDIDCCHWSLDPTHSIPLIEKWIENDAPVGTKLEFSFCGGPDFGPLFDNYESRKISREGSKMRMKTDNPQKHILTYFSMTTYKWSCFCVVVIPSDIDESQYSKYTKL